MKASIVFSAACMLALSAAAPVFDKRGNAYYVPPGVDGKKAEKRSNTFYGPVTGVVEKRGNAWYVPAGAEGKEAEKRDPSNEFYVPPSVDGKEAIEVL